VAYFDPAFLRPSFLDNHDMNRFLWTLKGNQSLLKLAALAQFTLPGPPIIYYGTEVGLTQRAGVEEMGFDVAREPMIWADHDVDLFSFYQRLTTMRRRVALIPPRFHSR